MARVWRLGHALAHEARCSRYAAVIERAPRRAAGVNMEIPTRCVRSIAISIAILLAIVNRTQGFTLNHKLVRPHNLDGEESFDETRRELRDLDDSEFNVAPIVPPLQRVEAMPLTMTTESPTTVQNEVKNVTIEATMTIVNDTSSDWLELATTPSKLEISNTTTNLDVTDLVATTKVNEFENLTIFAVKELQRYTTPVTTVQDEMTTTVITMPLPTATDNYIEATDMKETNASMSVSPIQVLDSTISPNITDTLTESYNIMTSTKSPIITETLTESYNITTSSTESPSNSNVATTPVWKKYTSIERKPAKDKIIEEVPPNVSERHGDSLNAHTTETRVSLEEAFDLAPHIPSLQELKTHLMESTNSKPAKTESPTTKYVTETSTSIVESSTKETSIENIKATEMNATEMVSKRAGYLNHTKQSVAPVASAPVNATGATSEVEMEGVAYEIDMHDDNEDTQNMTSHSQLAEDALKEEFLVEERLDSILFHSTPTSIIPKSVEQNEITANYQNQSEDLTVRPINNEKKNLYTVKTHYKPLKKIEVQPSKPFVRDPDDNSWRNESLSSLGIVFKGKNSSKAFTEVLKNKTEIEMSNLFDHEKTVEKVELRDRLEKIAEKRKSKKKKITDNYGNIDYTDYEENSSGDTHTSKEKHIDVPGTTTIASASPNLIQTLKWTTKGPVLDESVYVDSITTSKISTSKKLLQDYYDSKDEDVDYVTFPNIDILKSTPRPRVQWPVTQKILDNTKARIQPVRQFLPDRQPTVQYFPPRSKTVDSVNNYDDGQQKLKPLTIPLQSTGILEPAYTMKDQHNGNKYAENYQNKYTSLQSDQPFQHVEYRPVGEMDARGYVIRQYKDLLETVIKDADYERNASPYGRPSAVITDEGKAVKSEEYDYGQRKEDLNKFVDNFNQNHERFKSDFPVVFNTSIVHGSESGKVLASSSAMFKRLYNGRSNTNRETFSFSNKPYDPTCENITVELSPSYELHYYVPEQEETGDHTVPYGYPRN